MINGPVKERRIDMPRCTGKVWRMGPATCHPKAYSLSAMVARSGFIKPDQELFTTGYKVITLDVLNLGARDAAAEARLGRLRRGLL